MTPRGLLITGVFTAATLACHSDRGIDSDLPGDREGSALSDSERMQLCAAGDAYLDDQFTEEEDRAHTCIVEGRPNGCAYVDECLADHSPAPPRRACAFPLAWTMCDATVAELEACWTDIFDARGEYLETLTCTSKEELRDDFGEACNRIEARCPRFPP